MMSEILYFTNSPSNAMSCAKISHSVFSTFKFCHTINQIVLMVCLGMKQTMGLDISYVHSNMQRLRNGANPDYCMKTAKNIVKIKSLNYEL